MSSSKRKAPITACSDAELLRKIRGEEDPAVRHEVKSYTWFDKHECSSTQTEHSFQTKRQALLFVAKRNSEQIEAWIESNGRTWEQIFTGTGVYALIPNSPFDLLTFCELSDEAIEEYGNTVCNAFSKHKILRGTTFRYAPIDSLVYSEDRLLRALKREKPTEEEQEHRKRQALLLSDIAGFD